MGKPATIKCDVCGESYAYEETGCADSMPDGFLVNEMWICDDCTHGESCCICGKPAEDKYGVKLDLCDCVCPQCGAKCFDDVTIADHGMCIDCHKKWQFGELDWQKEGGE